MSRASILRVFGEENIAFLEEFFEGSKRELRRKLAMVSEEAVQQLEAGVFIELLVPLMIFDVKASAKARVENMSLVTEGRVGAQQIKKGGTYKFVNVKRFKFVEKNPVENSSPVLAIVPDAEIVSEKAVA